MYQVEWLLKNRIILMRALGNQSIETLTEGLDKLRELFAEGEAPVHLISDNRYLKNFPMDFSSFKKLMNRDPKSGMSVVLGSDGIAKFATKVAVGLGGNPQPFFADTVEDALALLISNDETLPKEIPYKETYT